jgi:hypothetical protein
MTPVHKFVREEKEAFIFKGMLQNHEVELLLIKETGELMINADDVSRIFGNTDFGDLLSQNEPLQNAILDDMNKNYIEYSNTEMLMILADVNKIEDNQLRLSLISKLGVE